MVVCPCKKCAQLPGAVDISRQSVWNHKKWYGDAREERKNQYDSEEGDSAEDGGTHVETPDIVEKNPPRHGPATRRTPA
jgi:hypothetical protein